MLLLKVAYADALESSLQWLRKASTRGNVGGGAGSERWSSVDRSDPMDGSVRARALTAAFDQMRNGSITPREYGKIVQGTAEFDRLVLAGQSSAVEGGGGGSFSFALPGGATPRLSTSSHVRMSALSSASIECLDVSDPFGADKSADVGFVGVSGGVSGSGSGSHVRRARVTGVWRQERFARTHNAPLKAIVTSVSGALVASANELGEVLLWTRRAKERKMRAAALDGGVGPAITAMAILGDELLLTASKDTTVCVWALPSGVFLRRLGSRGRDGGGHSGAVSSVSAAILPRPFPTSALGVATRGSGDGADRLGGATSPSLSTDWEAIASAGTLAAAHDAARHAVAISGAWDKEARLWRLDGRSRSCIGILHGHRRPITAVALSADASLALTGGGDRRVIIWSLSMEGKAVVEKLPFPDGAVQQLAPSSAASRSRTSGSSGGSSALKRGAAADRGVSTSVTRVAMRQIRVSAPVTEVRFLDPNGRRIVVVSDDGTVSVWSLQRPTLIPLSDEELLIIAANEGGEGKRLIRRSIVGGARCLFSWCAHGVSAGDATKPTPLAKVASRAGFLGSLDTTQDRVGVRAFAVDPCWKQFYSAGAAERGAPSLSPLPGSLIDTRTLPAEKRGKERDPAAPRCAGNGPKQALFATTVGADRRMCVWRLSDPLVDAELAMVGAAAYVAIRSCVALVASVVRLAAAAADGAAGTDATAAIATMGRTRSAFGQLLALNNGAFPWHVGWEIMGYVGPGRGLSHFFSEIAPQLSPAVPIAPPHSAVALATECFHLLMPVRRVCVPRALPRAPRLRAASALRRAHVCSHLTVALSLSRSPALPLSRSLRNGTLLDCNMDALCERRD